MMNTDVVNYLLSLHGQKIAIENSLKGALLFLYLNKEVESMRLSVRSYPAYRANGQKS